MITTPESGNRSTITYQTRGTAGSLVDGLGTGTDLVGKEWRRDHGAEGAGTQATPDRTAALWSGER
jgi:hypothetical protein